MGIMKGMMEKHLELIGVLSDVLFDMEDSDNGYVTPVTYMKIREVLGEESPIPEVMQKQIETWRDLYGENSIS